MMLPDVVTRVLAPCLGATLSNVTYLSSLPAILRVSTRGAGATPLRACLVSLQHDGSAPPRRAGPARDFWHWE